jgi:predicted membrane channel-forming protein YqfA (hemolysin III family)
LFGGSYTDYVLKLAKKRKGRLYPEMRLLAVTVGGILYPLGMVAYGWTIEYNVNLAAPLVVWGIA